MYARYVEPELLTVNYQKLEDGPKMRVAMFSDVHFGKNYSQENIERIVSKINAENPDIVVFGGDFFDHYSRDEDLLNVEYIAEQLAKIKGEKYAVWGNHDYGGGASTVFEQVMSAGGFTLLRNESLYLENYGLNIIGYDDLVFGQKDESLYYLNTGTYNLLLSHEPDIADDIKTETEGLMFSGHSHGGQINLPYITKKILPYGARSYVKGLYSEEELGSLNKLFVSSGIGTTYYPVRFLVVPEVVIVDFGA